MPTILSGPRKWKPLSPEQKRKFVLDAPRQVITAATGETVAIDLPSIQGSPYLWVVETTAGVACRDVDYVTKEDLPGASSITEFTFELGGTAADQTLRFILKAPWEDKIQEVREVLIKPE